MFIQTQAEYDAAFQQLMDYLKIENPSEEEKARHTYLTMYIEDYMAANPQPKPTLH